MDSGGHRDLHWAVNCDILELKRHWPQNRKYGAKLSAFGSGSGAGSRGTILIKKRGCQMNDSISLITARYDLLTPSECKVADYIMGNISEAITQSVQTVAKRASVSEATVMRFCKNMGYDGFRSFCIAMAQNTSVHDDYVMEIRNEGKLEQEVSRVLMASAQTIQDTLHDMDFDAIQKAAQLIVSSRNLLFVGMGTSGIVCQDAMLRFLRSGRQAFYHADYHAGIVAISHFNEQDVVVGISHSGVTQEVCESLELARKQGAHTIGVTTYPRERISQSCEVLLTTITRESPLHKVAITSRASQLSIIDALFIATMLLDYDASMSGVLRVSDNITAMDGFNSARKQKSRNHM